MSDVSRMKSESPVEREIETIDSRLRSKLGLPAAEPALLLTEARKALTGKRLRVERASQILNRMQVRLQSKTAETDWAEENEHAQVEAKLRAAEEQLKILQQTVNDMRIKVTTTRTRMSNRRHHWPNCIFTEQSSAFRMVSVLCAGRPLQRKSSGIIYVPSRLDCRPPHCVLRSPRTN